MRIYFIYDPTLFTSRQQAFEHLDVLLANGCETVQLRSPQWKKRALYEEAVALKAFLRGRARLFINDHVDVAVAAAADGVHLGQKDLPIALARAQFQGALGLTANQIEHFDEDAVQFAEYVGVGAVFPTQTKRDTGAVLGVEGLRERVKWAKGTPVIAIGGIDANNVELLRDTGIFGVAMVSGLSIPASAAQTCQKIMSIFK